MAKNEITRRNGGHKLREAFEILGISEGTGHALIKAGKIKTVRLGPRLPIITDREIDRLLGRGTEPPNAARVTTRSRRR
jgi:predicted site-specific integrase-resolvase